MKSDAQTERGGMRFKGISQVVLGLALTLQCLCVFVLISCMEKKVNEMKSRKMCLFSILNCLYAVPSDCCSLFLKGNKP